MNTNETVVTIRDECDNTINIALIRFTLHEHLQVKKDHLTESER